MERIEPGEMIGNLLALRFVESKARESVRYFYPDEVGLHSHGVIIKMSYISREELEELNRENKA